jgi:hypothetical protein
MSPANVYRWAASLPVEMSPEGAKQPLGAV